MTKILSLEMIIFDDGEKRSRKNYFEIPRAPSELPANQPGQFGLSEGAPGISK